MNRRSLDDWLDYQESLHPRQIDLGLERVQEVYQRLVDRQLDCPIVIVGGTNGKGSTVACLEAIYRSAGYTTASYTSPHIDRYNERIKVNGQSIDDAALVDAFERIESCRDTTSLTYFEFGTLAALLIFHELDPDIALLEVGLGGRLDAVNILEPDVSIISSIGLDHMDWLGSSIEQIAVEKAGIARNGKPLIFAGTTPPVSLVNQVLKIGANLNVLDDDFGFIDAGADTWTWWDNRHRVTDLPLPALPGKHQLANCSAALTAVEQLKEKLPVSITAIKQGLKTIHLAGRYQVVAERPTVIHDVAHNAQAAQALADVLQVKPVSGKTHVVIGMQSTKQAGDFILALNEQVDYWYACTLSGNTVYSGWDLAEAISQISPEATVGIFDSVAQGMQSAMDNASAQDRIIVTGSFLTLAQAKASEHV
jgi:dihydrofolate synthase/folylpolyglutamate synthase